MLYPAFYASSGVAHYGTFDPAKPELVAYELVDGTYRELVRATGDETVSVTLPFPVTICPTSVAAG